MSEPTFTVTLDGTEHSVPADSIKAPEGHFVGKSDDYVQKTVADAQTKEAVKSRLKNHVPRDKAAEDAEVVKAVLHKHAKKGEVDAAAIRSQVEQEYAPKVERLTALEGQLVDAAILEAARGAGVKDEFLKPLVPGQPAPIVQQLRGQVTLHEEYGYPVARLGEGFAPAENPSAERPFAGPEALLGGLKNEKSLGYLFKAPEGQGGSGYRGGGDGAGAQKRSAMTTQQKSDYVEKHGHDAYLNLPQ